ncbi:MAG: PAS domain-containing protein [Desulfuromonadales bacterium]|nr:PAS domain-containing protein [Desulfuromonadales bacterium]
MDRLDNPPPSTLLTQTDPADMKQTGMLLDEEKRFYSGIIQNAAAPLFVINSFHNIVFWNNALAKMTGISSFQMKGTKLHWSPFYPAQRPLLADLVIDHNLSEAEQLYSGQELTQHAEGALKAEG